MLNVYYLLGVENFAYFVAASSKIPLLLSETASRKIALKNVNIVENCSSDKLSQIFFL